MKALSIRQPWVWAILNAGKRVENRDWDPNGGNVGHALRLLGSTILIHAGKGCTVDEYEGAGEFMRGVNATHPWAGSHLVPGLKDPALPRGLLVAQATLADVVRTTETGAHRVHLRGLGSGRCLLCRADGYSGARCPRADPWAIPRCLGLILADVVPLAEPVPFKGALGFFDVPDGTVPT